MIDDPELRELFQAECNEHLERLEVGLLRMEQNASDRSLREEVFREAHSLKGAARMVGVQRVELVAHCFEEWLGAIKSDAGTPAAEAIELLYQQIDVLRQLVHEAVTGVAAAVDVEAITSRLNAARGGLFGGTVLEGGAPGRLVPGETPEVTTDRWQQRVDAIRVAPERLDTLLRLTSELTVAQQRIRRRATTLEQVLQEGSEWARALDASRFTALRERSSATHGSQRSNLAWEAERHSFEDYRGTLARMLTQTREDATGLERLVEELSAGIQSIRLTPLAGLFALFPRMVRDLAKVQNKQVQLLTEGGEITADKGVLEGLKDPLMHMVRNAVDHGIEPPGERVQKGKPALATVTLRAFQQGRTVVVEVRDDGRGRDLEKIGLTAVRRGVCTEVELKAMTPQQVQWLIFTPGISTATQITDISGRGVGLDVVHAQVVRLKGVLELESHPGAGCCLRLRIPISLAATRILVGRTAGLCVGIPLEYVHSTRLLPTTGVSRAEGRETLLVEERPVPVIALADLLGLAPRENGKAPGTGPAAVVGVILIGNPDHLIVRLDALSEELEVVVQPLGGVLRRVRNIAGATVLGNGEVCLILNPLNLTEAMRRITPRRQDSETTAPSPRKRKILLVDDSMTTRTQEKRILEGAGYEVVVAVDGLDAWTQLAEHDFDAVVSDVEMPNLNGLELTRKIRSELRYQEMPVILVTSLESEADRRRGIEVGANAYLTKPSFDQRVLLDTLRRLA